MSGTAGERKEKMRGTDVAEVGVGTSKSVGVGLIEGHSLLKEEKKRKAERKVSALFALHSVPSQAKSTHPEPIVLPLPSGIKIRPERVVVRVNGGESRSKGDTGRASERSRIEEDAGPELGREVVESVSEDEATLGVGVVAVE